MKDFDAILLFDNPKNNSVNIRLAAIKKMSKLWFFSDYRTAIRFFRETQDGLF